MTLTLKMNKNSTKAVNMVPSYFVHEIDTAEESLSNDHGTSKRSSGSMPIWDETSPNIRGNPNRRMKKKQKGNSLLR